MTNTEITYSNKKKPGKTKAFFICLVIASFLWLIHSLNTVYTYSFKIPVKFLNIPQNKRPLDRLPEQLTIDVKASGLKLALMHLRKPFNALDIDFNSLKTTNRNQNYILSASRINFKNALRLEAQIKHVSPDTLYFTDKTGFQKNVPVKVPFFLKARQGYVVKKPQVSPAFISIHGDTSDIEKIDTIYTQPVQLNDLYQGVNTRALLLKPNSGVYTGISEASVLIEVERLLEQSITIPVSDIRKSSNKKVNIFPAFVKVKFTLAENSFSRADTAMFKAMIDSEKLRGQNRKCPVFLGTVPGHVTVMEIDPPEVEVLIIKSK